MQTAPRLYFRKWVCVQNKTQMRLPCPKDRGRMCENEQVPFVGVQRAQLTPLLNYFRKGREWQRQQFLLLCCTVSLQPTVRHDTTSASAMLINIELKDEAPHLLLGVFSPPASHSFSRVIKNAHTKITSNLSLVSICCSGAFGIHYIIVSCIMHKHEQPAYIRNKSGYQKIKQIRYMGLRW